LFLNPFFLFLDLFFFLMRQQPIYILLNSPIIPSLIPIDELPVSNSPLVLPANLSRVKHKFSERTNLHFNQLQIPPSISIYGVTFSFAENAFPVSSAILIQADKLQLFC
jgi:hypothetical protein